MKQGSHTPHFNKAQLDFALESFLKSGHQAFFAALKADLKTVPDTYTVGTDPEHELIRFLVEKGKSFDIACYRVGKFQFSPIELKLIRTASEVQDMGGKRQLHASYTHRGRTLSHSRLIHSIEALITADRVCCILGLNETERQIIRLQTLLHDIGHAPFSHAGQEALSELTNFDHDILTNDLIRDGADGFEKYQELLGQNSDAAELCKKIYSSSVGWILKENGFDPNEIIQGLDDDSTDPKHVFRRLIVKEVSDRHAYIKRDLLKSMLKNELIEGYLLAVLKYEKSLKSVVGTEGKEAEIDICVQTT